MVGEIIFISVGVFVAILGYLIKFRNKAHLIAGYNDNLIKHRGPLQNWVGLNTLIIGLMIIFFGLVPYLNVEINLWGPGLVILYLMVHSLIMFIGTAIIINIKKKR